MVRNQYEPNEMPRVLSPGNCAAATGVTLEPGGFDVLPASFSPLNEKWLA